MDCLQGSHPGFYANVKLTALRQNTKRLKTTLFEMESLAVYKPCDATGRKLLAEQGKDVNMEIEYGSGLTYVGTDRTTTKKSHLYLNLGIIHQGP